MVEHLRDLFRASFAVIIVAALVSACGGGGSGGGDGTQTSDDASGAPSALVYVLNSEGSISRYVADGATGRLYTEGMILPFFTIAPFEIILTEGGQRLYISVPAFQLVSQLDLDESNGEFRKGGNHAVGAAISGMALDPAGRFLYGQTPGTVHVLRIDAATGVLTPIDSAAVIAAGSLHVDPLGDFLLHRAATGDLQVFLVDGGTGTLTEIDFDPVMAGTQPFALGAGVRDLAFADDGRRIFALEDDRVTLHSLDRATSSVTFVAEAQTGEISLARSLVSDPEGRVLFAASGSNVIIAYTVDTSTGELTRVDADDVTAGTQNFITENGVSRLAIGPSNEHLLVAHNAPAASLLSYPFNAATGKLGVPAHAPGRRSNSVLAMTVAPRTSAALRTPRYLYASTSTGGAMPVSRLDSFRIDPATGALDPIESVPIFVARSVVASPSGRHIFSVFVNVDRFEVDPDTGLLTLLGVFATPNDTVYASSGPSGYDVFTIDLQPLQFNAFSIGFGADFEPLGNWNTGVGAVPVTIVPTQHNHLDPDPLGQAIYLARNGAIHGFQMDANLAVSATLIDHDGLTLGQQDVVLTQPERVEIDPTGRFAAVYEVQSGDLLFYTIDSASGAFESPPADTVAIGAFDVEIVFDPTGEFMYAADQTSRQLHAFRVLSQGQLEAIDADPGTMAIDTYPIPISNGDWTNLISFDPSGRFLYFVQGGAIGAFEINAGGTLTSLGVVGTLSASGRGLAVTGMFE